MKGSFAKADYMWSERKKLIIHIKRDGGSMVTLLLSKSMDGRRLG